MHLRSLPKTKANPVPAVNYTPLHGVKQGSPSKKYKSPLRGTIIVILAIAHPNFAFEYLS